MNSFNEQVTSSIEVIEIDDDKNSDIPTVDISNDEDIIDITDDTHTVNNSSSIITIIDQDEPKNSKTISSNKIIIPFGDGGRIINRSTRKRNNRIELITLSDNSDEENTLSKKPKIGSESIIQRVNNIVQPLKRAFSNSLCNRKKKSKINDANKPRIFPFQTGALLSATSNAIRRLRPIIIDGLNIGYAHGGEIFSVKGIEICINYFADRGHKEIIAFIPHHRKGPPGSESNTVLNALSKKGHVCFTPSRKINNFRMTCHDDRIILNHAFHCGGVVVSNDNFRDIYPESYAFQEIIEQRQVMITFVKDEIIVPDDQYNMRQNQVRFLSDILCYP